MDDGGLREDGSLLLENELSCQFGSSCVHIPLVTTPNKKPLLVQKIYSSVEVFQDRHSLNTCLNKFFALNLFISTLKILPKQFFLHTQQFQTKSPHPNPFCPVVVSVSDL